MAKILCAYSGVECKVEHFPVSLTNRECFHPIFTLPRKKLIGNYPNMWAEQKLTATENYLYFLALLNSTERVEWRVAAAYTEKTASIIAQSMPALIYIVGKIDIATNNPALNLPHFVISSDTNDLTSIPDWIKIWNENYADFQSGYKTSTLIEKLSRRETALERLIKDKNKTPESYAATIAEWAADAAQFPIFSAGLSQDTLRGKEMSLSDYWKLLIRKCASKNYISDIPQKTLIADLQELIEHCELNIDHGSIYSHALMLLLRNGLDKAIDPLGLNHLGDNSFHILDADASVEDANKMAMIDTAPAELPKPEEYPTKIAYLRAKLKYDMAQEYKKNQESADKAFEKTTGIAASTENKSRRMEDNL